MPIKQTAPMRYTHNHDRTYQDAVEFLLLHPQNISEAWNDPPHRRGGALFLFCTPSGHRESCSGCLSTIREASGTSRQKANRVTGFPNAEELADRIRQDDRIPKYMEEDRPNYETPSREALEAFGQWQADLDALVTRNT